MKLRLPLSLVFLAALAGCTGVSSMGKVYDSGLPTHFTLAGAAPVPTLVRNDPFPGDASGAAVAGAFSNLPPFPYLRFAAAPNAGAGYHVVMAFGEQPIGGSDLCRAPDLPTRPMPEGRTAIYSVFCLGPKLLSEARASIERIDTPQDPRFDKLMRGLKYVLFPPDDPEYHPGENSCRSALGGGC